MDFQFPELRLPVSSLDGVPGRPLGRPGGVLYPEDVRRDAAYQALARRNALLTRRLNWALPALAVSVAALVGVVVVPWVQRVSALATAIEASAAASRPAPSPAPVQVAPPALQPQAEAAVAAAVGQVGPQEGDGSALPAPQALAAAAVAPAAEPAPAATATPTAQAPGPQERVPAIDQSKAPPVIVQVQKVQAPVRAQVQDKAVRQPAPAAAKPTAAATRSLTVLDFFGGNKAVLLSSDGGQTVRTYRVGDTLPSGEVLKAIDAGNGSIATDQRTIHK